MSQKSNARKPVRSEQSKIKKPGRPIKKYFIFGIILLLLFSTIAGFWDYYQLSHKVHKLDVNGLTASVNGAENILVAGSTNRCNLTVQNVQWGFCSQGVTGVNSDIIFIIHIVPATKSITILSIPRDTFIPNARSGAQAYKIDAALYEGPTQLVNAIQEDFGIPIQHYVEVGFDGFVNIVNAIGGVKMYFPMPVYDAYSYLNVQSPGCKTLNGVEALQVVRARHIQYKPASITTSDMNYWPQEAQSDIARITRTHEFLKVLAAQVAAKGISNPITDQKIVDAIAPQVQVDSGFSTSDMLSLLEEFHAVNINKVTEYTLPVATTNFGDYIYNGNDYGDVVFPVEPNDQQTIDKFLNTSSSNSTFSSSALPKPSDINVSVENGSGISEQATTTTSELSSLGFNATVSEADISPVSYQAQETEVIYASPSTRADALSVASRLGGYVILDQDSSSLVSGSNVTVITGSGLSVNVPNTSTSSSVSSAANSLSAAENSLDISAPNASTSGLSAWDPRACSE
jgi:LCP family protein required for cell wall assembly